MKTGNKLPINLQDLLCQRTVEGERIEYKAGWNATRIAFTGTRSLPSGTADAKHISIWANTSIPTG